MNLHNLLLALALACGGLVPFAPQSRAATNAVSSSNRPLLKEPAYQSTPKYCLLALGDSGDVQVWLVEDGERLFVDQNANGDLTDDGPPIEPGEIRHLDAHRWDFEYALEAITPAAGPRHTNFVLRRWNYHDPEDCYGLSLSVAGQMPMYAGWFGTFWSTNLAAAPVIHFGGPFTPKLLRRNEFTLGETHQRLSLCFIHPGATSGADSRLSIQALPRFIVPQLHISWPTAAGAAPLQTSYELTQRCCYWEFYTTDFDLPSGVVPGPAKISVDFLAGTQPIELTTTQMVMQVTSPSNRAR